jgi:putative ABC transport system permease protein
VRHDLWFALRRLRRQPLHAALIIATLGMGLGASLAVFAIVDAVLLRPLPFPAPERLLSVTQSIPVPGFPELSFSGLTIRRIREGARTIERIAGYGTRDVNLVRSEGTERLISAPVTAGFFRTLGASPSLGRAFTSEEDLPGGPRAILISDGLWRTTFAANRDVIGSVANLEGELFTIVGVMPPWFAVPSRDVSVWEPARLSPAVIDPGQNRFSVVARLREGVSLSAAQSELTGIIREVGREYPGPHPGSALDPAGYHANTRLLADSVVGDTKPVIILLLGGVLLLLLLTCANVANLQLANVILRASEISVRAAVGATRARLVSGALLEGILLTTAGAVFGVAVAAAGATVLVRLMPASVAIAGPLLGARVLFVAAVGVLVIGAVVGAIPVAVVAGRDPSGGLHDRAAAATPRTAGTLRRALAVAQVALAVLLVHGAGLLIASAREVQRVALGFRTDSTISLRINLPAPMLRDRTRREVVLRRIVQEVSALPGVQVAGLVNALPLELGRRDQAMAVEGRPFRADGSDPIADYRVVTHGYFATMGIPLLKGRLFTDDDATATLTPLVISRGMEKLLFPNGEHPLGRRLRFGPASPWMPIIGVVDDAKNRSVTEPSRPEFYTPGLGSWSFLAFRTELTIVARVGGDAMALAAPIRRVVRETAPDIATYNLATLDDVIRVARARMTTATQLMSAYAVLALLLAVAGTYALLAYLVSQRRHELAIRLALGATRRDIVTLVAGECARLVGFGAAAGLLGAVIASRLLSRLLFGVGTLDPVVTVVVLIVAAGSGVAASLIPARRATSVDPGLALRPGG